MASKRRLWSKFGRFLSGLVIACFFLPFFGVSCQGMDVVTISGADMVGGCKPGGLIVEAADQQEKRHPGDLGGGGMSGMDAKIGNVQREPLAILALALVVIGFGMAWVRTRGALVASFALSLAALGALAGLYVKVSSEMKDEIAKQAPDRGGGARGGPGEEGDAALNRRISKEAEVESGSRLGLWCACLGLIGIASLSGLALREPEGAGAETPSPPAA